MKLQINENGAWRNVVSFDADREQDVRGAALILGMAIGSDRITFRILDDDNNPTVYCGGGSNSWKDFKWSAR